LTNPEDKIFHLHWDPIHQSWQSCAWGSRCLM
jgi:hypothetical protein